MLRKDPSRGLIQPSRGAGRSSTLGTWPESALRRTQEGLNLKEPVNSQERSNFSFCLAHTKLKRALGGSNKRHQTSPKLMAFLKTVSVKVAGQHTSLRSKEDQMPTCPERQNASSPKTPEAAHHQGHLSNVLINVQNLSVGL